RTPAGREVQDRFVGPPGLVIIIDVLGKTAGVHQPVMRADAGPFVSRGFAAIIETGPDKSAAGEGMRGVIRPPGPRFFGAVLAVSGHIAIDFVNRINAAGGAGAAGFGADG